jgi:serine/threonine-protein kinase HipA
MSLPTVRVTPGDGYVLTERYDRVPRPDGSIKRLHQEDFCQALGYPPFSKYEEEGGPNLAQCFLLLKEWSTSPAEDMLLLLKWQILNLLLGNADGHAKNISLLYRGGGTRLAPFYDLVCTAVYTGVSRDLAMRIGGESDPGRIGKDQWEAQALQLGIRSGLLLRTVRELCDRIRAELSGLTDEYISAYGENPVLERIQHTVMDRVRRARTLL